MRRRLVRSTRTVSISLFFDGGDEAVFRFMLLYIYALTHALNIPSAAVGEKPYTDAIPVRHAHAPAYSFANALLPCQILFLPMYTLFRTYSYSSSY